jgi:hypothetical protein
MSLVMKSVSEFFGRLFRAKPDNYKALLMADLGIER